MTQITLLEPDESGRIAADQTVREWLKKHGISPHFRPRQTYSNPYCRWLDKGERERQARAYLCLQRQQWRCWWCGYLLASTRACDVHHIHGYDHDIDDETGWAAVHRGRCHRAAHLQLAAQKQTLMCGKRAA